MKKYFLIGIILIGIFFRFYHLSSNPPSLTWDEAAWGYNAYSLGIDGRDEFGRFLPFDYLESFGDFKPPVYAYLDIVPVKLFGLNAFSTRFPSALFGVLTVLVTYFLVRRIFFTSRNKEHYALLSALFLAISPWHILLSRAAFEANVASFFVVTGIWLFLCGIQEKKWYLMLSALCFVISMDTFNTERIVTPLLIIVLIILFRKQLLGRKREFLLACIIGIILFLPLVRFLTSPQAKLRFQEVNIFTDNTIIEESNREIKNDGSTFISKIIHNRRVLFTREFFHHYFDNLTPSFLFIKGDGNPKFSTQEVGQMYIWDLVFFIFGILLLFRKKEGFYYILPLWLLLGIIPAATARETPHALRIEVTLPTFQILTAYGFYQCIELLKKRKYIIWIAVYALLVNILYFTHDYFIHYPIKYANEWQYGYRDTITYVKNVLPSYDYVYMTDILGRPYIYCLYYMKDDPKKFRQSSRIVRDPFGFVHVTGYGKFIFDRADALRHVSQKKILFIDAPQNVQASALLRKNFYLPDGEKSLVAYTL